MFPFKKLTFDNKKDIEQFTSKFEPYSDFNFTSLWTYNIHDNTEYYLDDNTFIVKFPDYTSNKHIYSLLTNKDSTLLIDALFQHLAANGEEQKLSLVPETTLVPTVKNNPKFLIEEDRDNFDYILDLRTASTLNDSIYKFKRRHVHQFLSHHPNHEIRFSRCKEIEEKAEVLNLFNKWASTKAERDTSHEMVALKRLLHYTDQIDLICVMIFDQQKLVGFAFVEQLGKYSIGSFMKGDPEYEYIYDMLYYQCAVILNKLGCEFLNYEQDLGILPMRDAKMHWHPTLFLKKYSIKQLI